MIAKLKILKDLFFKQNKHFTLIFILLIIVTVFGINLDLIVPDAALYASISKTIAQNNDFINLYALGRDWLDKPHLPFWLTAISFKLFGINNFAYKIPGILTFFFGLFLTYKFTQKNYNTKTAVLATIILATATHTVISNFDVRAEPYLTTFIIGSIYFIDSYLKFKKLRYFVLACFFTALAIMTKGVFVLIPIVAASFGELMIKKNWKQIFNPVWLLATVLIFIFILPELLTLYMQFDLHPEKTIFNRKNVSGLHFFFWESQVGRFFNTAPMKGSGDPFFFFHTILWAFLPWGILYYIASFLKIKRNFKKVQQEEFYTIFGSLAAILIFSLSKFQLPHYTNIVFPFMAIMVADFIYKLQNHYKNLIKTYAIILWLQNTIGVLIVIYLFIILKPEPNFNFYVFIVLSFVVILSIYKSKLHKTIKLGLTSSIIFLTIFSFLFTHFYPVILKYQGDVTAAKFTNKYYKGNAALIDNNAPYFGFEFYVDGKLEFIKINNVKKQKGKLFYIGKQEYKLLKKNDINFTIIKEIEHFHISKLNAKFLNKPTRNNQLEKRFLVEIE